MKPSNKIPNEDILAKAKKGNRAPILDLIIDKHIPRKIERHQWSLRNEHGTLKTSISYQKLDSHTAKS